MTFGITAPGYAQDSAPAGGRKATTGGVNPVDIIVTARRVEERVQDGPISISAFNQQLTDRKVTNSADLANYTPSLSASSNFDTENTNFAIRGFVQAARPSISSCSPPT